VISQVKDNSQSENCQDSKEFSKELRQKILKLLKAVQVPPRDNHYFLVPLRGKVPLKGFALQKLYDGTFFEYEADDGNITGITGYGLCTGLHWLVVLDFDDEELYERFRQSCRGLETFTVKTKRGYHVYFVIKDKDVKDEPSKRFKNVDVKTGRSYVVLPYSSVDVFTYSVASFSQVMRITYQQYQNLLKFLASLSAGEESGEEESKREESKGFEIESKGFEMRGFEEEEESRWFEIGSEEEGSKERDEVDEEERDLAEKIAEKLLDYYVKGQRQSLCLAISGYILKKSITYKVAEEVIKILHARSNDEDPLRQRLSALEQSLKKPREILTGASLLKELVSEETLRELDELTNRFAIVVGSSVFVRNEKEQVWEEIQYKNKKAVRTQICSLFTLLKVYSEPELRYVIHSTLTDEIVELSNDVKEFKNVLHVFSSSKLELLLFALTKRAKIVKRKDVLGWDKNKKIFYHPALVRDFEFIIPKPFSEEDFHVDEETKRKHHELIYKCLREGSLLGAKYVLALSSIFGSFSVIDVAPRGVGKTLSSWLACQLFCRYRKALTLFATETAIELLFAKFKNFPFLLDEGALTTDEKTQKLVFLLKSGIGKLRGTKHLKVQARDVEGVAFLTSERDFDFDRLGAERRIIKLQANDFRDYTTLFSPEQLVNYLNLHGAGIDYISFYLANRQEIDNAEDVFKAKVMSDIPSAISKAFKLLQLYYKDDFESLKNKISRILKEQEQQAEKDVFEIFVDKFKQFVIMNQSNFDPNAKQIFGKIEDAVKGAWKVYILTKIFDDFCRQENFSKDYILKRAKEEKILEVKDYNRYAQPVRLIGKTVSVYVFSFREKEEQENLPW